MTLKEGYIYILSNKAFINNLYKIGLTQMSVQKRAEELSKSTSAPGNFLIEYTRKVQDVSIAEKRIHLLLNEFRYSKNKEYYLVELIKIRNCIDSIAESENNTKYLNGEIYICNNLVSAKYSIKQSLNDMKLFRILFAHSLCNTALDHITEFNNDDFLLQGFLSSKILSQYLATNVQNASRILKSFKEKHKNTFSYVNGKETKVFYDLRYLRGELGWIFTKEYRNFFISSTL